MKPARPYIGFSGNRKMSAATFNLPAIATCPGSTPQCRAGCYARKAEKLYKAVLPRRMENLRATQAACFVSDMVQQINKRQPRFFRIHESGDFYSQEYLAAWYDIARQCPATKFLAFTKSFKLDFAGRPQNLEIIFSIWPDSCDKAPRGPKAYAGDCGNGKLLNCPGDCDACGMCWDIRKTGLNVHFDIH